MKKNLISKKILKSIQSAIGRKKINYFLHEPNLNKNDNKMVNKCINSKFVSTVGKFSELFSKELKKFTKAKYVLCLNMPQHTLDYRNNRKLPSFFLLFLRVYI